MLGRNNKFSGVPPQSLCWRGEDTLFLRLHVGCHVLRFGCHGCRGHLALKPTVLSLLAVVPDVFLDFLLDERRE